MIEVDVTETSLALELVINKLGVGGITGLLPTVAVRRLPSTTLYLDWGDLTFKSAGWATKYQIMVEVERGIYQQTLNIATLVLPTNTKLTAEYNSSAAGSQGEDFDLIHVTTLRGDATLLRKALTNRLEEVSGNPGSLTLYDDNALTVLRTWPLRDETGAAVLPAIGTPARRGPAV
jgi:hypothetical protein